MLLPLSKIDIINDEWFGTCFLWCLTLLGRYLASVGLPQFADWVKVVAHSDLVQSVLRSLDILDMIAQSEKGLSLQEICSVLGLKQPTAYNLIRTLVSRNYVERTGSPVRYRLGGAVVRLADDVTNHQLVRRAGEGLRKLYHDIVAQIPRKLGPGDDVAVSFAQAIGGEIRLLLRVRSDRPDVLTRPMSLMGPYRSTSSLIYQAYWTPEERAAYRRAHPFAKHAADMWKNTQELDSYLFKIRQQGYASPPIYPEEEFRLSVPVFDEGQTLVGVYGVGIYLRLNELVRFRITRTTVEAAQRLAVPSDARPAIGRTGVGTGPARR